MLSGLRPITEKTIQKIESLHGFAGWFDLPATGTAIMDIRPADYVATLTPASDVITVPLLANSASMGPGADDLQGDVVIGSLALSAPWVERFVRPHSSSALRFIHAYGDSMTPTINDGDILLVDTSVRDASKIDGIYVLRGDDRLYVKRVRSRYGGPLEVSSDNPVIKTVDVLNGDTPLDVLGRVVWIWNGHGPSRQ